MQLATLLAADYANIAEGGKLNVMGIFTIIYATKFPTVHPSMFLVIKLSPDFPEYGQERKLTISLVDEDGKLEVAKLEGDIKVPMPVGGQKPEINLTIQLQGLLFPKPGKYQFTVLIDKDFKGSLGIQVEQVNIPTAG
jgi:hypothetical protein